MSAPCKAFNAFNVINSGSPGPNDTPTIFPFMSKLVCKVYKVHKVYKIYGPL